MTEDSQRVEQGGEGNIAVVVRGSDVSVQVGTVPTLHVDLYETQRGLREGAQILIPFACTVPVLGREAELADLRRWLEDDAPFSIRLITGKAGTGKTRLALELCEAIAVPDGWVAGFLDERELERFQKNHSALDWRLREPTLLVVDYAAAREAQLKPWLTGLALAARKERKKLRVLLLERHGDLERGWCRQLFGGGRAEEEKLREALDPPEPVSLDERLSPEAAREIFRRMLVEAAEGEVTGDVDEERLDARLADLTWGRRPLLVSMAAVAAREWGVEEALGLSGRDLVLKLGRREVSRVQMIARGLKLSEGLLEHLVTLVILRRGLEEVELVQELDSHSPSPDSQSFDRQPFHRLVLRGLRAALPREGEGQLPSIQPDLLAEAYVLEWLGSQDHAPGYAVDTVRKCWRKDYASTSKSILHLAQDLGPTEVIDGFLDALLEEARSDPVQLESLSAQLPWETVALRGWTRRLHELRLATDELAEDPARKAALLSDLAHGCALEGRREGALVACEEAVRLCRKLAAARPDAFAPDLAMSLNNLANILAELGRREEALAAGEEAVRLRLELAAARPDAFAPYLAMSLNNLANILAELGRREEALAAGEEAVRLRRKLAAARPDVFAPDLAMSLNNLANRLSALGRREEALAAAEEAARLYRELAAARPDAFVPYLAASLNNLANCLSALGRREEALAAGEKAVRLYRELAAVRPDAFAPDLAASLNNLASLLSALGRREEALAAGEEAVRLRRELAAARPDAFAPDLAMSLNNLASFLSELGRFEEALAAGEEAVQLRRELAAERPGAFAPDLAASLSNLSSRLNEVGRLEEALMAGEEAVRLYRELAAPRPDAFAPDLAASLNNLANRLSALGRLEEALAAGGEAVRLRRELAAARPDAFVPNLAMSLNNLANCLGALGRLEEALAACEEALQILSPRFLALPAAFGAWMGKTLQNYFLLCQECQQEPDHELIAPLLPHFMPSSNDTEDPADD